VSSRVAPAPGGWVARSTSAGSGEVRLFCFPYAGAGASVFRSWQRLLPPWLELCAVQLPGRENRRAEPLRHRLADLVLAMAQGLEPLLDPPFAFFGHSLGALLAFELCRTLRRAGWPSPAHLFVSAHTAPQLAYLRRQLYHLPDPELVQELRRYDGTAQAVLDDVELVTMLLPVLRADFELLDTYSYAPEPPLDVPISAFAAPGDPEVRVVDIGAWKEQTSGPFSLRTFAGGHLFMQTAGEELVAALGSDLEGVVSAMPPQLF
jgi:medium-chain acyl-[acyl-carrier-protein] hydrolase